MEVTLISAKIMLNPSKKTNLELEAGAKAKSFQEALTIKKEEGINRFLNKLRSF